MMKTDKEFSKSHLLYLKQQKRSVVKIFLLRIAMFVGILTVWELLTALKIVDRFIFSSPSAIAKSLYNLTRSGELFRHAWVTLYETLLGFILATVIGTALALVLWWNDTLKKTLEPFVVVLNSLPKIALGPIIIIWFGSGRRAIVVMAVLIGVIVTLITMLGGFEQTDQNKILLLKTFGASKLQILSKLVLPSSLSTFISTLKINVGLSWIGSIMGEYLVSKEGLGYLIVYGGQVFKMDLVFAATLVLCLLATGMYALICLLEKLILRQK